MSEQYTFYLTKFIFNLVALQDMILPEFKGSTIHGAFGWEFNNSLGPLEPIYDYVFESPASADLPIDLKGVKNVPHPLIITPPLFNRRTIKEGEVFSIGLTLIGDAKNFTPFLIETVRQMGDKGLTSQRKKFRLLNIYNKDIFNVNKLVYEEHKRMLKADFARISEEQIIKKINYQVKILRFSFITPFVVQRENRTLVTEEGIKNLDAAAIISSLERRYRHLAWLYCNHKVERRFYNMLNISLDEKKLYQCTIIRESGKEEFYGLKGSFILQGELAPILPLIYIGEQIHLGKKTSFGFGKYRIEDVN